MFHQNHAKIFDDISNHIINKAKWDIDEVTDPADLPIISKGTDWDLKPYFFQGNNLYLVTNKTTKEKYIVTVPQNEKYEVFDAKSKKISNETVKTLFR